MMSTGPRGSAPRLTGSVTPAYGLPVGEVLGMTALADARLVAGRAGLDRVVQRLNVMEVPDILAWVKSSELLLTTGYPLRNTPQSLARLVVDLDRRGLAALAIKLGRYLDELPADMLEEADRLGFPIILLHGDVAFDDILNQVLTEILNRQAAELARSEEVHRALLQIVLDGGGLREVTDEVADLLDVAVLATDADGRGLASSGATGDVAALGESGEFGPGGLRSPDSYGAHGRYAVVPVVAGGHDHGRLAAYSTKGDLDESAVHTLERAATVAALVITKQQAVTAVESKYRADFLRDVLAGRAGSEDRIIAHGASLGWDLNRPVTVLVAETDPEHRGRRGEGDERATQDRLVAAWSFALRRRDAKAAVAGFSHEVVGVLGAPVSDADLARAVRDATAGFADPGAQRTFSTGVSRVVTSPGGLSEAYDQAIKSVRVGRQLNGAASVAHFDQLGVYRLLSLVPETAELHAFVRESLGDLAVGDDPETADLRHTLQVLLETNLNVAESARRLHFHYNTLRYRIGKLERILGPFTEDAHLRLNLSLALHDLRMRGI